MVDEAGVLVATGGAPYAGLLCLDDGTYTVTGNDSYGDGWNGNVLIFTIVKVICSTFTLMELTMMVPQVLQPLLFL